MLLNNKKVCMTKIPYTAIYDIDFNDFEAGGSRTGGAAKMKEIVERWANSDAGQAQFQRILDARQAGMLPDAHFPIKVVERRGLNSFDDIKTMTVGFDPFSPTRIMTKTGPGAEGYTMQISDPAAIFGHETEHYLTHMLRLAKGIKETPQNEFCLEAESEKLSVDAANAYRQEKGQPLRHGYQAFMPDKVAGMKNWFKDTTGVMDKFILPKVRKDYADRNHPPSRLKAS